MKTLFLFTVLFLFKNVHVNCDKISRQPVYFVTPSPSINNNDNPSPVYNHNWKDEIKEDSNGVTTTEIPLIKSSDLIFADFKSGVGNKDSLSRLLEKESTKELPIISKIDNNNNMKNSEEYFNIYNNLYSKTPDIQYGNDKKITTTEQTVHLSDTYNGVQDVWDIINSHKQNSRKWDKNTEIGNSMKNNTINNKRDDALVNLHTNSYPTSPGVEAENESRSIRNDPKVQFPYVNLKTFQMKAPNTRDSNNMFMNLDDHRELNNPIRGEVRDYNEYSRQPIDRYNPAQPYLPSEHGKKNGDSTNYVGTLAAPPPPPPQSPPKGKNDFPLPNTYDSFPPYTPDIGPNIPSPPKKTKTPISYIPPDIQIDTSNKDNSDSTNDNLPTLDLGYRYNTPSAPIFRPTLPPMPMDTMQDNRPMMSNMPQQSQGPTYSYEPPNDSGYGDIQDNDYPQLIYSKPQQDMDIMTSPPKGGNMGFMAPPPPPKKPIYNNDDHKPDDSDHGFPNDFPLKFNLDALHDDHHDHDYDDHHYHYHHHPTTTTTTTSTTETPRVNRYSYYYLGKKLYYLPLYFSVYFIVYVGALIIKAVLRHKIVYPNSWKSPEKRSVDSWDLSNDNLHEITGLVTKAIANAAQKYMKKKDDPN